MTFPLFLQALFAVAVLYQFQRLIIRVEAFTERLTEIETEHRIMKKNCMGSALVALAFFSVMLSPFAASASYFGGITRGQLQSDRTGQGADLVRNAGRSYATVADLQAAPIPNYTRSVFLQDRPGWFVWSPVAYDIVNLDPMLGLHIAPSADLTGSSGVWVRSNVTTVFVDWFGAVGDFDPATGTGTDSRAAIQAAINYVSSRGGTLSADSAGHYYLGSGYSVPVSGWQIVIGDKTAANKTFDLTFDGNGASFYQGAPGKMISIHNGHNLKFLNSKLYGYAGGTLGASREQDALLQVGYYSKNVEIAGNYLTNSLGDCINITGAVDVAGGGLVYYASAVNIHDNILKERFGDGVRSADSGTMSREAIAIIDVDGAVISNNIIYGSFDFEPNLDYQVVHNVSVNNNQFRNGSVEGQAVLGGLYWYDEPLGVSGGDSISNSIYLQGPSGVPDISQVSVVNNKFETATIKGGKRYEFSLIAGNTFKKGLIKLSDDSGLQAARRTIISGNHAEDVLSGEYGFIKLNGQAALMSIVDNYVYAAGAYCVDLGYLVSPGFGEFDSGNYYSNNVAANGSDYSGNFGFYTIKQTAETDSGLSYSPEKYFTISGTGIVIDFMDNPADNWYLQQAAGVHTTITDISNALGDGQKIEIMAEASAGGSVTFVASAAFKLRGGVDAVLANTNAITLRRNFGRWVEVSRNF